MAESGQSGEHTPVSPAAATGELPAVHAATNVEVKKWGVVPAVVAGLFSVLGTGGIIAFLLGYAGQVEAKSVAAAQAIATVQAQRIDVLKGDVDQVKSQVATLDAGVAQKVERLEKKIDEADRRSQERYDRMEAMQRQMLVEIKKGR